MNETIRISHGRDYTTISNFAIRDKRLSFRARGLHHLLLSYPDGWKVKIEHLAGESEREGKDAIAAALKELEELGYLIRTQIRDKGRILGYESVIREQALDNPPKPTGRRSKAVAVLAVPVDCKLPHPKGKKPQPIQPETIKPDTVEPQPDKPDTDKPELANPVHNKYLFNEVSREEVSIPPIAPQKIPLASGGDGDEISRVEVEIVTDSVVQAFSTNDKSKTQITPDQESLSLGINIPVCENNSLYQIKPNGSEQFPWEQVDPVKGWVIETGFWGYVAIAVKDYSQFKNLPIKRFQREVLNYFNKAHFDGERRCKLLGYWRDYQDEPVTDGLLEDPTLTVSQVVNVAQQQQELQRIHNASKKKFTL